MNGSCPFEGNSAPLAGWVAGLLRQFFMLFRHLFMCVNNNNDVRSLTRSLGGLLTCCSQEFFNQNVILILIFTFNHKAYKTNARTPKQQIVQQRCVVTPQLDKSSGQYYNYFILLNCYEPQKVCARARCAVRCYAVVVY